MRTCERAIEHNRTELDQQVLSQIVENELEHSKDWIRVTVGQQRRQNPLLAVSWAGRRAAREKSARMASPPAVKGALKDLRGNACAQQPLCLVCPFPSSCISLHV